MTPARRHAEGHGRRPDRGPARRGITAGAPTRSRPRSRSTGAPRCSAGSVRRRARPAMSTDDYLAEQAGAQQAALVALANGSGPAHRRLRQLEDAVGSDQSLPAPRRQHRIALRRQQAEHPGAVHLGALGLARVVRRAAYPNTKKWYGTSGNSFIAVVEFGDSVQGPGGHRRRRKRRSRVEALR